MGQIIAGNWKMNGSLGDAAGYAAALTAAPAGATLLVARRFRCLTRWRGCSPARP